MKDIDLDLYKSAWKSENGFEKNRLSENDIQNFLKKRSKNITGIQQRSLILDIILKSMIGIAVLILIFLFRENPHVIIFSTIMLIVIIISVLFQAEVYRQIPQPGHDENIRTSLEKKINFYTGKYYKTLYTGALSNSLFFISASLFYTYFKYGGLRPLDAVDFLVFGILTILGFVIGIVASTRYHNFKVRQLESCLIDIDEGTINEINLINRRNRRIQIALMTLAVLIFGLLVLIYFIF